MGFTLVEGRNYCKIDNAYSNGSGKSSIFNGICFALTGETAQGISSGIENIFTDPEDCWVELSFFVDGNEYLIKRYKTPKQDLKIYINGEDYSGKGIRESTRILSTYLPDLTSTLVNSIIILGQGLPSRFTDNKPSHRKEILENLTKSDFMIQSIKDKLERRQLELKTSLRAKEDKLISINSQLEVYNLQLKNFNDELNKYDKFDSSEENINFTINSLQNRLKKNEELIDNYNENYSEVSSKLKNSNINYRDLLSKNTEKLAEKLTEVNEKEEDKNTELNNIKTDIKILSKEIKKIKDIKDICPTCGQKIPNVNKPDVSGLESELSELELMRDLLVNELSGIKKLKDEITDSHNKEYDQSLKDIKNIILELENKQRELSTNKSDLLKENSNLKNEIFSLTNLKDNYDKLIFNITSTQKTISSLEEESIVINSDILNIQSHLEIIQQMITLAKREFRGILLINVIEYINKVIKKYSKQVFNSEELNFSLNENEVDITYCDKPYENLSGGEKQKIDVIVQLALRDILSKQLNIRSNLLVCDEIFDNMDILGCNKIIDLISSLTDIDSIFIISHHAQDLEITRDNSIIVEKSEDGISKIKFV